MWCQVRHEVVSSSFLSPPWCFLFVFPRNLTFMSSSSMFFTLAESFTIKSPWMIPQCKPNKSFNFTFPTQVTSFSLNHFLLYAWFLAHAFIMLQILLFSFGVFFQPTFLSPSSPLSYSSCNMHYYLQFIHGWFPTLPLLNHFGFFLNFNFL